MGCWGGLDKGLDRYGTVGTGFGAGMGADGGYGYRYWYGYGTGTYAVTVVRGYLRWYRYGRYGTWVRFSYPCTVPSVPMYRTRTVPVYVPVPVPYYPYPHPNPYQPSCTYHLSYRPTSQNADRAFLLKLAKLNIIFWTCIHQTISFTSCCMT